MEHGIWLPEYCASYSSGFPQCGQLNFISLISFSCPLEELSADTADLSTFFFDGLAPWHTNGSVCISKMMKKVILLLNI